MEIVIESIQEFWGALVEREIVKKGCGDIVAGVRNEKVEREKIEKRHNTIVAGARDERKRKDKKVVKKKLERGCNTTLQL